MLRPAIALTAALLSATSALAAPTYIHASRVIAVPGQTPRGATTIVVDEGKIVAVQDGYAPAPAGAATIDLSHPRAA